MQVTYPQSLQSPCRGQSPNGWRYRNGQQRTASITFSPTFPSDRTEQTHPADPARIQGMQQHIFRRGRLCLGTCDHRTFRDGGPGSWKADRSPLKNAAGHIGLERACCWSCFGPCLPRLWLARLLLPFCRTRHSPGGRPRHPAIPPRPPLRPGRLPLRRPLPLQRPLRVQPICPSWTGTPGFSTDRR